MSPQRNVSFPQLLQVNGHEVRRIKHHLSPAGKDNVECGEEQQLGQNHLTCGYSMGCIDFSEIIQNGSCGENFHFFIEYNLVCFMYN